MYRLNKTVMKMQSFKEADMSNVFLPDEPLGERLNQGWYLSAMAHGINPYNPPKMQKHIINIRKHKK
ncbi:MAG: hypothetical protein KA319_02130 [Ferruginibacter sp.]|nr:hypothetical protein [Ferruginibacter sp.]